ncbi:hypothetical protein EXIGLDRAFT_763855 [Exidia glandulosa HHB12029]|uniref:F-box domain-containing protein n=1 Tax=Exidia glandulosa HHB12029 TaxID=1314781 RepID=A0A165LKU1_EXIGL|nr:hypothetical protein EXIGLDRAFT_763855 [Exidia glandulosa HHB12029]
MLSARDALTFGLHPLLVTSPRQCTVKPTSSELDFYALCSEINDLNWTCLLPLELFCRILDLLPTRDLVRASLVCRRWRAIALNTPTLWTHVAIIVDYKRKREDLWAPALDVLLSRSCGLPLSLFLWVIDTAEPGTIPAAESAVAMLIKMHLHRIRSLYLMIPGSEPHSYWYWDDVLRSPAPALERFSLASLEDNVTYLGESFLGCCSPRLHELHLEGNEIYDEFPVLESVKKLNYLTISCVDAELAAIAACMPNLQDLILPNWACWGVEEQYEPATGAARFDQELDLRISTGLPKTLAESYFTRPKSICYASTESFEEVLLPIFECGDISSLDIRWTTYVTGFHTASI